MSYTTAHIPGSGPAGLTCRGCRHCSRSGKYYCFGVLRLRPELSPRALAPIDPSSPACKYFEAPPSPERQPC